MKTSKRNRRPTFKKLCDGKVWRAIDAMLKGLEKHGKRKDFKVDMDTFGSTTAKMCFGCAATCTIQQLAGINFTPEHPVGEDNGRAKTLKMYESDLEDFEMAIDHLRKGNPLPLFEYMGVSFSPSDDFYKLVNKLKRLDNKFWRRRLGPYRDLLKYLKALDL